MKSQLLIATFVVYAGAAACNYTVGDCWPVGQGGSSVDVGVGVGVGSTGSGPSGDGPPGQAQSALSGSACNSSDDNAPVEAGLKIFCSKPDWGKTCSDRCFARGIPCVFGAVHPHTPMVGVGSLFSCNDLPIGYMCGYHYSDGSDCYFYPGTPFPTLCAYSGNN